MITTYQEFQEHLNNLVKIRSKNYVNTNCDIAVIMQNVYAEISTEVNFFAEMQEIVITKSLYNYALENILFEPVDNKVIGILTDTYEMVDSDGEDVSNYFTQMAYGNYILNSTNPFKENDVVFVLRKKRIDLEYLSADMYEVLIKATIEGMMFQIQDSVPSQIDGQLANLQYQRFFNAKKELRLMYPQYERVDVVGHGTNGYFPISKGL